MPCSDTSDHDDASGIHNLHLSFGWDGIGYHKIILRNGVVQNGEPEYWVGAHVYMVKILEPRNLFNWKG